MGAYLTAVLERLTELIRQSHGHTLVLFTSYRMMELVYQELLRPAGGGLSAVLHGQGAAGNH